MKLIRGILIILVTTLISSFSFSEIIINNSVKWHPGHYITIKNWGKDYPKYMNQVYNELKNTPAARGIQIRYYWYELETAQGVYDFSSIDRHLRELASINKQLIIQIQTKTFREGKPLIPDYMKTENYGGGQFAYLDYRTNLPNGNNIKLWNKNVRDRLIALFSAFGKRYNLHPNFEGIGMIESALGIPYNPYTKEPYSLTENQRNGFYENLIYVNKRARMFFPNTLSIQEVNYPIDKVDFVANSLREIGAMLSGPDVFSQEEGLLNNVYHYYRQFSGLIPVGPQVMEKNYKNTKDDGTGYKPTVNQILKFARDYLLSNYIFWGRDEGYYQNVLMMLKDLPAASLPSGTLSDTCPEVFKDCVNKLINVDLIKPIITIENPKNGVLISKTKKILNIQATAADNLFVQSLDLYIQGKKIGSFKSDSLNYNWNITTYPIGNYNINIIAYDAYGNSNKITRTIVITK